MGPSTPSVSSRRTPKGLTNISTKAANELKDHRDVDLLLARGSEGRIGEGLDYVRALREVVAAQMCGRWRNGIPYAASPDAQSTSHPISETNFDYDRALAMPRRLAYAARQSARRDNCAADRQSHPTANPARHVLWPDIRP